MGQEQHVHPPEFSGSTQNPQGMSLIYDLCVGSVAACQGTGSLGSHLQAPRRGSEKVWLFKFTLNEARGRRTKAAHKSVALGRTPAPSVSAGSKWRKRGSRVTLGQPVAMA